MLRLLLLLLVVLALPARAQDTAAPEAPVEDVDAGLAERLQGILDAIPAFEQVEVRVDHGVARLEGGVASVEVADRAVELVREQPGVVYVVDDLDAAVGVTERVSPTVEALRDQGRAIVVRLPLFALAMVILFAFWYVARAISSVALPSRRLRDKPLIQGLIRQVVRLGVFLVGVLIVLELLDVTALVGALLGTAGILGVAVGFAFQDIVENYLASIILSLRQPFAKNDLVQVGDYEGKVVRLTLRETVLMTLDGNHLRIPNAQVFKSVISNYTLNPLRRFVFTVGVGVNEDLTEAADVIRQTLRAMPGVLDDPAPAVLVDELADSSVVVEVQGWVDQRRNGFFAVRSEAVRRVKAALDDAGVDMPEPVYRVFTGELVDGTPPVQPKGPSVDPEAPPLEDLEAPEPVDAQIEEERQAAAEGDLLTD